MSHNKIKLYKYTYLFIYLHEYNNHYIWKFRKKKLSNR
jgi:hypothetical protein